MYLCSHICVCGRCLCTCVCCADDFPVIIFNAEQREHVYWLASVAKHSLWQEIEEPVISAKTLMENLTQIESVGVYAQVCINACAFRYLHMSGGCLARCQNYNYSKDYAKLC